MLHFTGFGAQKCIPGRSPRLVIWRSFVIVLNRDSWTRVRLAESPLYWLVSTTAGTRRCILGTRPSNITRQVPAPGIYRPHAKPERFGQSLCKCRVHEALLRA